MAASLESPGILRTIPGPDVPDYTIVLLNEAWQFEISTADVLTGTCLRNGPAPQMLIQVDPDQLHLQVIAGVVSARLMY